MKYWVNICLLILLISCHSKPSEEKNAIHRMQPENISKAILESKAPFTLVSFYASWCKPCVKEFPEFIEIRRQDTTQIQLIMVSVDEEVMYPEKLADFLLSHHIDFPTYYLPLDSVITYIKTAYPEWKSSLPLNFLYQKDGSLLKVYDRLTRQELKAFLETSSTLTQP